MTRDEILKKIKASPLRMQDLCARNIAARAEVRKSIDSLVAAGLIKMQHLGRIPYYIASGKDFTLDQRMAPMLAASHMHDGCREWVGYTGRRGPMANVTIGRMINVRRYLWEKAGRELASNECIKCTCENDTCISLTHMMKERRGEAMKGMVRPVHSRHKQAIAARKSHGKLTPEVLEQIRSDDKPGKLWAQDLGVCPATISAARRGKTYKSYGSHFAGLGAR